MLNPETVLEFWFADARESPAQTAARKPVWFSVDPDLDQFVWETYADAVADSANGHYDDWLDSARGRLALIIMLDQFPRNMFRGTSEVFRYDAKALEWAGQGVTLGQLADLSVPEQAFFLMPYQHAEDLAVQRAGVDLMGALVNGAPPEWAEVATSFYDFAVRHHDIVAEYGRFPHRNSLLGRRSTEAETRYLEAGGATFGQSGRA